MSCNCKRKIELEEKYGENEELSWVYQLKQKISRIFGIMLFIAMVVILTPIIICIIIYSVIFRKNNEVILPKFLRKYMKK